MQRIKEHIVGGTIAVTCFAGSLSLGDAVDVNRNYITPALDRVRGVETAEDYAPHHKLDLESRVNDGERKTYLEYRYDGEARLTPVGEDGYAEPSWSQWFDDSWQGVRSDVEDTGLYEEFEHAVDKAQLVFDHYRIKIQEFWDEVGGD